jgi:pSer/pThr/pTyr-binding forkhead associated (FHA) protein
LTVNGGGVDGREYAFRRPALCVVGRGADCEIRLPNKAEFMMVSRHHCALDVDPPNIRLWDCGSHNGTRINGMQIGRPSGWAVPAHIAGQPCVGYELHGGDEFWVGSTVFRIHVAESPEGPIEPPEDCPEHLVDLPGTEELCLCGMTW